MFPEEAMHCVEWARDQFGKIFTQKPKVVNKCLEEGEENQEIKIVRQVLKHLKKSPTNFDDCVRLAREKFQKFMDQHSADIREEEEKKQLEKQAVLMDSKIQNAFEKLRTDNLYIWKQSIELAEKEFNSKGVS